MEPFNVGDVIEHNLMPGFTMTVEGTEPCETDANRSEPHLMYQVTDPDGNTDWLCAHDVRKPSIHAQAREAARGMWSDAFGSDPF